MFALYNVHNIFLSVSLFIDNCLYICAASGCTCTSDDRKKGKYAFMQNVQFHAFPSIKGKKHFTHTVHLVASFSCGVSSRHAMIL